MNILSLEKIKILFEKVLYIVNKRGAIQKLAIDNNSVSRFSSGTIITGTLYCADSCFFDGQIDGNVEVKNKLVVGENSTVNGTIYAGDLMAKGKIKGNILVKNEAIYSSTSISIVNILRTNLLVVESGAILNISNLLMRLDIVTVPLFVSRREDNLITDNKSKVKKVNATINSKISLDVGFKNKNDDTLLFDSFQQKANDSK